jgi:glycosyltransferase involved in cell wall biosynthesis
MRLLALVDSPNHVCCRYRIRAFEPALRKAGWSLCCQALKHGFLARAVQLTQASHYDAVILQRKLLPSWEFTILREHARHLVFDFDDAVLFRDSYDRRGPYSTRRERQFALTVRSADAVIAGNDFLADCALRAGTPAERVRLIPTCIDPALYQDPGPSRSRDDRAPGQIDLVWIGSASTLQGLEQAQPLWDRLGREIPGLRLRVICDRFPRLEAIKVIPVPWSQQWESRDLAAGQIGISWLPNDPWSWGKCGLKVLQYQAAGLPVVANPVGMHVELIEPGATGFLPSTDDEWVDSVRTLVGDDSLRRQMGILARQRVAAGFSIEAWADTFVNSIAGTERLDVEENPIAMGSARSSIPDPFFVRLRRMRRVDRAEYVGYLDGKSGHD